MEAIQNQILRINSNTHQSKDLKEVVQVLTPLFKCLYKEYDQIISDIKHLRKK